MNSIFTPRKSLMAAALLAGAMICPFGSLHADEALDNWVAQSRILVDKHMRYPAMAIRFNQMGASYLRVTIDREGRVLDYDIVEKTGSNFLDRASLRTVEKIKHFPEIPAAHAEDEMTFGVRLRFGIAYSADELRKMRKKTRVKVQEMSVARKAGENSSMSSYIVILAPRD